MTIMKPLKFIVFILSWMLSFSAAADTVQVAVASNFAQPMARIAAAFQRDLSHHGLSGYCDGDDVESREAVNSKQ